MGILKKIIIVLVLLIALLGVVGLLLPSKYQVERSTVINAPAEVVFDQVNDLKKNEAWSPWKSPSMKITYGPVTAGKGATSSWTSDDMGSGKQTIEESNPPASLRIHLDFGAQGEGWADWTFAPEGEGVKVTQTMTGDQGLNPAKRWVGLMMDKLLGGYFEKGLASLKQVSEARAAEVKAAASAPAPLAAAPADSADSAAASAPGAPADSAKAGAPADTTAAAAKAK